MQKISIVIPAAGQGRRMKSYGPKALIDLGNNQVVLERQLAILKAIYPDAEFIVVLGFGAEKVYRVIPSYVKVIENDFYDLTNVAKSIQLGLEEVTTEGVLIVYGDLVFNAATFNGLPFESSFVLVDNKRQMDMDEVGVTIYNQTIHQFSYTLPAKWAQIAYLQDKELESFRKYAADANRKRFYGFEILNMIVNNGGVLNAIEPENMRISEIDASRDIDTARLLIKEIQ